MRKPSLEKWEYKPELEGLLLFSQIVEEMLFNYTLDSYRVQALNALISSYEVMALAVEVESGVLKKGVVKHVCDELAWQIENDPIALKILGESNVIHSRLFSSGQSDISKMYSRADYVANTLRKSYFQVLKDSIKMAVDHPEKKRMIIKLARVFLSGILGVGYSQEYVYIQTRNFFFYGGLPKKITSTSQIVDFLDLFDLEQKEWIVVHKGSGKWDVTEEGEEGNGFNVYKTYAQKVPSKYRYNRFFKTNNRWSRFIEVGVQAKDEESARKVAHSEIGQFAAIVRLFSHSVKLDIQTNALVKNAATNEVVFIKEPIKPVMRRPNRAWASIPNLFKDSKNILAPKHLSSPEAAKIYSSIELHSAAVVAGRTEEQLLNLWTSLESLVPRGEDSDYIVSIVEGAVPLIMMPYTERLVHYIYNDLKKGGHSDVTNIIDNCEVGDTSIEKTAAILALKMESVGLDEMLGLLDKNPLARTRLYHLGKELSDVKRIRKMLKRHEQRIRWQLRRIYRTRNMVIHTGKALPYLDIIVENLHYYLDLVHHGLSRMLDSIEREVALKQVFDEAEYHMETWRFSLERNENKEISEANYKELVLGPFYAGLGFDNE